MQRFCKAWAYTAERASESILYGFCGGSVVGGVVVMDDLPPVAAMKMMPLGMVAGGAVTGATVGLLALGWPIFLFTGCIHYTRRIIEGTNQKGSQPDGPT